MPQTAISLPFADGEYEFRLGLAQINEIQNRCNAGIGAVFARVLKGRYYHRTPEGEEVAIGDPTQAEYRIEDVLAVIRQGLIGGGKGVVDGQTVTLDANRINQLMDAYVVGPNCSVPLRDSWALAAAILHTAIEGYEPLDEAEPEDKRKKKARAKAG